jgi:hypothetical protein
MPRGYSYDHFQVPKREPRERATPPDTLKAATAKKGDAVPLAESQDGLHYGRKNAETLRRLKVKAQQRKTAAKKAAPAARAKTGTAAKAPSRGAKTLERVAVAAKKGIQRVAKKVTTRKTPKKR